MNTLSIWNPIHEMDALFHNRLASVLGGEGQASVAWSPVVDIEETEQDYVISAELPGLDKDKVKVTVEDGVALGSNSVADTAAGVAGYDPVTGLASTDTTPTWQSTSGAPIMGLATPPKRLRNACREALPARDP